MSPIEKRLLSESINIGNKLLDSVVKGDAGWYWYTFDSEGNQAINYNFYNGNSGIVYFLNELYKKKANPSIKEAIDEGCKWLINICSKETSINLALYCGFGGVVFTLLQVGKHFNKQEYIEAAISIAKKGKGYYYDNKCDILHGSAGAIITLLHLYNETKLDWVKQEIGVSIDHLLHNVIVTNEGITWDRSGGAVRPLCGFAHGGSGIAFVFMELYNFFGNKIFYEMAIGAFNYEDAFFNTDINNWPDFRKDIYTSDKFEELINDYEQNNINAFSSYFYMSAWCHGAPGIGMARINAYKYTGDKEQRDKYERAVKHCREVLHYMGNDNSVSHTLCHGTLGNASILIDDYVLTKNESLLDEAKKIAGYCIDDKEQKGFYLGGFGRIKTEGDMSLLMGQTGIGHFYLRVIDPEAFPSILAPSVFKKFSDSFEKYTNSDLNKIVVAKIFYNLAVNYKDHLKVKVDIAQKNVLQDVKNQMHAIVFSSEDILLKALYELDLERNSIYDNVFSDTYLHIQNVYFRRKNSEIDYANLYDEELVLSPHACLTSMSINDETKFILFLRYPSGMGVIQYEIGKFIHSMLINFSEPKSVQNNMNILSELYEVDEVEKFGTYYKTQVSQFINSNILIRKPIA